LFETGITKRYQLDTSLQLGYYLPDFSDYSG
jgi:hypothetical protein